MLTEGENEPHALANIRTLEAVSEYCSIPDDIQ